MDRVAATLSKFIVYVHDLGECTAKLEGRVDELSQRGVDFRQRTTDSTHHQAKKTSDGQREAARLIFSFVSANRTNSLSRDTFFRLIRRLRSSSGKISESSRLEVGLTERGASSNIAEMGFCRIKQGSQPTGPFDPARNCRRIQVPLWETIRMSFYNDT